MNVFSDISIWWLFPWAFVSLAIGVLYYRNQKKLADLKRQKKTILILLRSMGIFLLGVLLFGLIVENKDYKTEKPVFITLVDNSASMLNYSDSGSVSTRIESFNSLLKERYADKFDFQEYFVGSDVKTDSLAFNENESNLDAGFDFIFNQYYNRNVGGICFISDGNYNVGKNPIYTAEKISLTPVFSVGVGDTIQKRDQLIRNLSVNEIAFYKNQFPVEIDIEAHKMGVSQSTVSIWSGGKMLASEKINYNDGNVDYTHVTMLLNAGTVGFTNYVVKIEDKKSESSYENNQRSFYVEVIDSRNKILILAGAPHPDNTAIRQILEKDENAEVMSLLIDDWDGDLSKFALLIWHDPGNRLNDKIVTEIKKSKIPVLYILGNQTNDADVNKLNIGLNYPKGNRLDEIQGEYKSGFQLFEVSDELKNGLHNWPPLTVRFGKIGYSGGNVLISQRIGPVIKNDPVLFFDSKNETKYGVLIGEGLWKWKLSEYARTKKEDNFIELIQKSTQYLTVKLNKEPLRVNLPKRFNVNENVLLNAEFYNSSFERITEPDISYTLTNEEDKVIKYNFARNTKDYSLSLGKLKQGKYGWTAKTKYGGKDYTKSGHFIVEDVSIEALSTHADHNLLYQISEKTNGKFYSLENIEKMLGDIEKRTDIVNISYEESTFDNLIDWKILFFLIVLLFGIEWFIRRYSGAY